MYLKIVWRGCVCQLRRLWGPVPEFFSEPNCGGSVIGSARIYSEGATTSSSHANYLYREAALLSVYENTARAAASGQRVYYARCSVEKTSCIKYLSFREGPAV